MCGHHHRAPEVPEDIKRRKGKRGLRKEGKVSRGYSSCYGVTIPRGCENADRTEGWDERKVSTSSNVFNHKVKKRRAGERGRQRK